MSFDTGYVGAHRWAVNEEGSYKWTCTCGDTGSIASTNKLFVMACFARHAHSRLEQAAVALLAPLMEATATSSEHLQYLEIPALRRQGEADKANLLQLVVNQEEER
jgi:hypothetical protein